MIRTRITELLGIELPIIQAGMQRLGRAELAAAVSNAGGLGTLTAATFPDKEALVREIARTRALTDKPFALNISLGTRRDPATFFEAAFENDIRIIFTSGRNPQDYVEEMKKRNIIWIHSATSVRHGLKAQELGADAVVAIGYEAGGHPGLDKVSTLVLVPSMVDALRIPVIAAGGIVDGRGLSAALALGAEGILMGTRFILTEESVAHEKTKQFYLQAKETDTLIIEETIRRNHRVIRNAAAERVLELEQQGAGVEQLMEFIGGDAYARMMEGGELDAGVASCGQGVGLIHSIEPAGDIVRKTWAQGEQVLERLANAHGRQLAEKTANAAPAEQAQTPPADDASLTERERRFLRAKQHMEQVPFWRHIRCKIEKIDPQESVVSIEAEREIHLNSGGSVHGGVYATLLDNAMGLAAKAISSTRVTTVSLNIHYVAAAESGKLFARGKAIHQTRSTFLTQGEVYDESGQLLAWASAVFLARKDHPVDPVY